jgi:tetratricopeptide (TPR) repeat protein/predicted Ser/Thr protein kinase
MEAPGVINAFLQQYLEDQEGEGIRDLDQYQALFPGYEELIAEQYARLQGATEPPQERPSGAAPSAFWTVYQADAEGRGVRPLLDYLLEFPDAELEIAECFARQETQRTAQESSFALQIGANLGPYLLLAELGQGGQGTVYLARDSRLQRKVAIKVLHRASPQMLRRFQREAMIASRLEHPGICTVYEANEVDAIPFVVMRYVEGHTLADQLLEEEGQTLSRAQVVSRLRLMAEVAEALHAAHQSGVLHRDIKPSNIMVPADQHPVILDFGLARDQEEDFSLTRSGEVFGTPAYMSPEQISTTPIELNRQTDIYSLGITLFEAVALQRPYEAPTREGLFRAILQKPLPSPRKINSSLPRDLEKVMLVATAKDRNHRYESAQHLAEDLLAICESRPIQAMPPSLGQRLVHWTRREPAKAVLAAGLAVVLLVAAGLGGFLLAQSQEIQAGQEEIQRREIERMLLRGFKTVAGVPDVNELRQLLIERPDLTLARVAIARAELNMGMADQALATLEAGLEQSLEPRALDRFRVEVLEDLGRFEEARVLRQRLGRTDGAMESFVQGIHRFDRARLGDDQAYEEAAGHFSRAVLSSTRAHPVYHLYLLRSLVFTDQEQAALDSADAMERLFPDDPLGLYFAGMAIQSFDIERAADLFERATFIDPELAEAHLALAGALLILGEPERAKQSYESSIAAPAPDRDKSMFHLAWGTSLLQEGSYKEAIPVLQRSTQVNPRRVLGWHSLAEAFAYLKRFEEAVEPLRMALEIDPDALHSSRLLCEALTQLDDVDGVFDEYDRRLGLHPDDVVGWNDYAVRLAQAGLLEDALDAALTAQELVESEPARHREMAATVAEVLARLRAALEGGAMDAFAEEGVVDGGE